RGRRRGGPPALPVERRVLHALVRRVRALRVRQPLLRAAVGVGGGLGDPALRRTDLRTTHPVSGGSPGAPRQPPRSPGGMAGGGRLIGQRLVPGGNRLDLMPGLDTVGVTWGEVVPSPDGQWIAATRHRAGHWSLVRWPAAAPESVTVLVDDGGTVSDPVWEGE